MTRTYNLEYWQGLCALPSPKLHGRDGWDSVPCRHPTAGGRDGRDTSVGVKLLVTVGLAVPTLRWWGRWGVHPARGGHLVGRTDGGVRSRSVKVHHLEELRQELYALAEGPVTQLPVASS